MLRAPPNRLGVHGKSAALTWSVPVFPNIHTLSTTELRIPPAFSRLYELAYNLWWSWDTSGRDLWAAIDPLAWERYHNPVELLQTVDPATWTVLEQSFTFQDRYAESIEKFDEYMHNRTTWYDHQSAKLPGVVAYLCTEFGIHHSLPIYSGGLGILAGDHAKSTSDMGIPTVAVGLLYRRGYFRQEIDADGDQQHIYPNLHVTRLPVKPVAAPTGGQLKVAVEFPGRPVQAAVWKLDVGRTQLVLLDTDTSDNDPADRPITNTLYVNGREMRFCQEMILGIGGVRALRAIGIEPAVWHVNEGHAAMSIIERLAGAIDDGLAFDKAHESVRSTTVFTLHTPVPAGNEIFEGHLVDKYLKPWATRLGLNAESLRQLGSVHDGDNRFDLGTLAIKTSRVTSGVSVRHAEVVSRDWSHLLSTPAVSVTNGVHTPTWVGRDIGRLLNRIFGPTWPSQLAIQPELLKQLSKVTDETLWNGHQNRKDLLVRFVRGRLRRQLARHGCSPDDLRAVEQVLPTNQLTLGFARRFATYKRADLIFRDPDRLAAILTNPKFPVQVVYAGKAHPADEHGQGLIRRIVELANSSAFKGHVIVLEDYDARMARFLVQGVDVWLNNPRPPMEASGTSGMKAAINGTLNLSVLDGWWLEGFNGKNGWVFGSKEEIGDHAAQDESDAAAFYRILEQEIVPLYYARNGEGIPTGWVAMIREAMTSSLVSFSAHRMVAEYYERLYLPKAEEDFAAPT